MCPQDEVWGVEHREEEERKGNVEGKVRGGVVALFHYRTEHF